MLTGYGDKQVVSTSYMLELQTATLDAFSHTRDLCVEVLDKGAAIDAEFTNLAQALLHYYGERVQSLTILVQSGRFWDAEIVYRSALECSTRLIYVCISDKEEREIRVREFFHDLQEVEYLERTSKAVKAVNNTHNEQTRTLIGGVVLSKEDELRLREKWPKKARKILKQKWSFSEMVKEIASYKCNKLDLTKYDSLLYSYNLSSHLIHADYTAIELTWDRNNNREPLELVELISAHSAKMLTDPVSILVMCLKSITLPFEIDLETNALNKKLKKMYELGDKFQNSFYDSQSQRY